MQGYFGLEFVPTGFHKRQIFVAWNFQMVIWPVVFGAADENIYLLRQCRNQHEFQMIPWSFRFPCASDSKRKIHGSMGCTRKFIVPWDFGWVLDRKAKGHQLFHKHFLLGHTHTWSSESWSFRRSSIAGFIARGWESSAFPLKKVVLMSKLVTSEVPRMSCDGL